MPHHGGIWVEYGWVRFRLYDENNTIIHGSEFPTEKADPQELAEDMFQEHGVPIHGSEELDFQTIEP